MKGLAAHGQERAKLTSRLLECGLWLGGLLCIGSVAASMVEAKTARVAASSVSAGKDPPETISRAAAGTVIGRLEIAKIGLSVPVLEDYDPATLRRGVGHVRGTAVPGGLGNLVLAGHRDTFLRPLRRVKAGMEVHVVTSSGVWRYVVDGSEIVTPEQVSVLDIGNRPELTLITCYPFDFIGSAPQRFIVHAHLVSADAG